MTKPAGSERIERTCFRLKIKFVFIILLFIYTYVLKKYFLVFHPPVFI